MLYVLRSCTHYSLRLFYRAALTANRAVVILQNCYPFDMHMLSGHLASNGTTDGGKIVLKNYVVRGNRTPDQRVFTENVCHC
jgi:hypothetical protein